MRFTCKICMLFAILFTLDLSANPKIVSVRAMGMGGVGVAYPQDGFAAAFNPAGVVVAGRRLDMEVTYQYHEGSVEIDGAEPADFVANVTNGTYDNDGKHFASPSFGVSGHWCNDCTWGWGVVGYNKEFINTNYPIAFDQFGTSKLGLQLIQEQISAAIGFKYYCHYFGVAVNFNIQRFFAKGLQSFNRTDFTDKVGNVTNRSPDYGTGWSFTVGWIGYLWPDVALGVVYEARAPMTRMDNYAGLLADSGRINFPERISAGMAVNLTPCMHLAIDLEHVDWSSIAALNNALFLSAEELFAYPFGKRDTGPGFGWTSETILRMGLDYQRSCWTYRIGFSFSKPAIKGTQTTWNILTLRTVQSTLHLGVTQDIPGGREISIYYNYGFPNKIHGKRNAPTDILGGGQYNLNSYKHQIGISIGQCW